MEQEALAKAEAVKVTKDCAGIVVSGDIKQEKANVEARVALAGRSRGWRMRLREQ